MLLLVGLLLLGLSRSAQVSVAISGGELQSVQAQWLARAGVEQAIAVLMEDGFDADGYDDLWYDDPGFFENVELAAGHTFRVTAPPRHDATEDTAVRFGVTDEASKLNVNGVRSNQLAQLPDITDLQADAILDWIDRNENARPGGAERGHYSELDFPYLIANAPMRTHREMLLVKDITPEDFFGEDTDLNGTLSRNELDGEETYPDDNADRTLDAGLAAYTTVHSYESNTGPFGEPRANLKQPNQSVLTTTFKMSQGLIQKIQEQSNDADSIADFIGLRADQPTNDEEQIDEITIDWLAERWESFTMEDEDKLPAKLNVNTATRDLLLTVPGMDETLADAIINERATNGMFTGVGQLYIRNVMDERTFPRLADRFTVRSNVFRIVSSGRTPSGISKTLIVMVDRGGDQPVILDWRMQP